MSITHQQRPKAQLVFAASARPYRPMPDDTDPTTTTTAPPPQAAALVVQWPQAPKRKSRGCTPRSLDQIKRDESGGSYTEVNPSSGAGGAYQFLPSTWKANGGQGLPQNASPAEQDRIAQKVYNEQGTAPWRASGC